VRQGLRAGAQAPDQQRSRIGAFITVVGKDSKTFDDFVQAPVERAPAQASFQRPAPRQGRGGADRRADRSGRDRASRSLHHVLPQRHLQGSAALEFSEANAAKLLYTEQKWVRSQVDEAIGDIENFMPA
jgi:hypothetical protein